MIAPTLFDEHAAPPELARMTIAPCTTDDVREFTAEWHYSEHEGAASWRYGLWQDYKLYGVSSYNLPTTDAGAGLFGEEHRQRVLHHGRLVVSPDAPHGAASKLIAGSLRQLSRDLPEYWAVLTFAAQEITNPETGVPQLGYVYQATNALYTGEGGQSTYYKNAQGQRMATSHVSRTQAIAKGWTVHKGLPKHRYVYILPHKPTSKRDKRLRRQRLDMLRYPVLPYPKNGNEQRATWGTPGGVLDD